MLYLGSAAGACAEAGRSQAHFVDLHVYRMGGAVVLHGGSLYQLRYASLPFTYPPLTAVVFAVLAALPWAASLVLLTAASIAALPVMLYFALRLPPGASRLSTAVAWRIALVAGAAAIWLEPAGTTLRDGQVDILLAAAVLCDLALPDSSRPKGALTGLAAGLKLTPLIFVAYLLVTGRYRAAATALAVFAAMVAAGFAALPASSAWYWSGAFADPRHVSPVQDPENQSLFGVLARVLHSADVAAVWLPFAALVFAAGMTLAAIAVRRGNEALGFCVCALTGLLISPISWTHHWVTAIPALLLAGVAAYRAYRDGHLATALAGAGGLLAIAVVGWTRLVRNTTGTNWLHLSAHALVHSAVYVVAALAALAVTAGYLVATAARAGDGLGACPPEPADEPNAAVCLRLDNGTGPASRGRARACRRSGPRATRRRCRHTGP
jgi:alpha-1,2-mannosyltransferase